MRGKFHRSLFSRSLVDFLILSACRPVASGEQSIQSGGRCLPTGRSQCGLRQASEQATKGGDGEGSGGNCVKWPGAGGGACQQK